MFRGSPTELSLLAFDCTRGDGAPRTVQLVPNLSAHLLCVYPINAIPGPYSTMTKLSCLRGWKPRHILHGGQQLFFRRLLDSAYERWGLRPQRDVLPRNSRY